MASPLDNLVEALHRDSADQIVLESEQPVRISAGSAERLLIAQAISTEQIDGLIRAFISEEELTSFMFNVKFSIRYPHASGNAVLICQRRGDKLRLIIRPDSQSAETELTNEKEILLSQKASEKPKPPSKPRKVSGVAHSSAPVPQQYSDPNQPLELDLKSIAPMRLPSEAYMPSEEALPVPTLAPSKSRTSLPVLSRPQPPSTRDLDQLLFGLADMEGSDLHLTSGLRPHVRVNGEIKILESCPDKMSTAEISKWVKEIAPEHALDSFERDLDADFAYEIAGYSRYRVNVFRDQRGVGIVVRAIPCELRSMTDLGLPSAVEELCELDQGLVLVTGATGSGKSTTLASMIDYINRTRPVHIITIEDPVEFVHIPEKSLINQRELHVDTRSFANALRAALREDPDVVLLGELRDRETIETALEVADTGHLVFGTLHTRSAVNTVARIIEQFDGGRQPQVRGSLAESLKGVISQTLCKAKDGGRVAAFEVLLGSPAVANLIREGKTYQLMSILQTSRGTGMRALNDDLNRLVEEDIIDYSEALKRSNNKIDFESMHRRTSAKPMK